LKRIIILCLTLFALSFSSEKNFFKFSKNIDNSLNLEFDLDNIEVESVGDYKKIKTDPSIGVTGIIGMPKLPIYTSLVMVDPTKDYKMEYVVKDSYIIQDVKIIPNQHLLNGLEKEIIEDVNINFYNSTENYPSEIVSLTDPLIMRDLVLVNLSVTPFSYRPSDNSLEVFTSLDIRLIETDTHEDLRRREMPRSRVFENLYKNKIINYQSQQRDEIYQDPAILYICGGSLENNSTLGQLIDWRKERGYIVYTASLSETGSSASSIKNYIENAYDNFNPPPEYVALVGDVGGSYSIPTYYEDYGHDSYGNDCEGDLQYSQLDGGDLFPEVLVGRMSLRSTSELSAVVPKIINYEKATYLGSLGNYYKSASMAGDPSSSGNSCAITKEQIKEMLENHDFTDVDIKTSGSSWSSWMQNELSDGALFFNYRGYLGMSGFSTSNVDNANSGYKLPFATILTCGTGSFAEDQTAMSEKFFRAGTSSNPKGGVAAIGTATWNTHTLFNNIVDMGIYQGLLADNVETAGAALASGKLALYNAYSNDPYQWINAFTQWNNLMGDPATHLWTDTPEIITASHPSEISLGTNYLDVSIIDESGLPIVGALVSIDERNTATNVYTDDMGSARFYLDSTTSGNTLITITKQNFKPYQGYVNIIDDSYNVNIDHSEDFVINDSNNGIPESGETLGLSIPLTNLGTETASGVVAILTSSSDHVSLLNETVSYGTIQSDQTVFGSDFSFTILPTAIQGEDLELMLNISDDSGNEWTSLVLLDILGIHLIPVGSMYLSPGQTGNIDIDLRNLGSLSSTNVSAELSYAGNQITINDSDGLWGNIFSGQTVGATNSFNVTLSNDVINGAQLTLNMRIQTNEGYDRTETVTLQAGFVSSSDPLGPDQYGYYIYDSGDDEYDLSPSYNWIDIESSGTNLNLSNSGNGNWSGNGPLAHIDLPFDFQFYGETYDEITVCTNGWLVLGYSSAEAFRNYPIPGAGGPPAMIAAFWDDLETGNAGDVFYEEFNDYVIVQWQDMRTQNNNSLETFQVILYNNAAQPYGDNEIKIQYEEFNNTSSGSFSSYPPIHGAYATIGIENHLADDGLQYSFLNQYPTAAMTLSDNTAIFITTQPSSSLPAPQLNYTYSSLDFQLESGQQQTGSLVLSNSGEEGSLLSYSVSQSYPDIGSPFDVTGGGPDSYGFYWTDSDISSDLNYNFIDISSEGTQVSFSNNDDGTELIDIGFDFSFYGNTYSQFLINPNGWIGFESDNDEWYNGNLPSSDYPTAAIFGFWDDLNPVNDNCNSSCSGNVYYHSNSDRLVVWFENVYHWASEGFENSYYNFQIVIYPNGEIDINIENIEGAYSATVGIQNSTGTIASQIDSYDGNYFNDSQSFKFVRPYILDWLFVSSSEGLNGSLSNGESIDISILADATDALEGDYAGSVLISSNASDTIEIPVTLNVGAQAALGDLNNDGEVNVSDIVILVSTILNEGDYSYNADINQDGSLDVLDIVTLVGMILNV